MQGNASKVRWPVDLSHMSPIQAGNWIATRYGEGVLPIRPDAIAKRMGVEIDDMTGSELSPIYAGPDGALRFALDRGDTELRQRLVIARGLGHLVLRQVWPSMQEWMDLGVKTPTPRDNDANLFAATLLVPSEDLRWCVNSGWARNADQIVDWFRVPQALVAIRYQLLLAGF